MRDDYERAIVNELEYWPKTKVEFSLRSKHRQAVLHFEGNKRFVTIPSTSAHKRGPANAVGDVRRELISLGAERLPRKPSVGKRARKVIGTQRPDRVKVIERAPVKPDPFAVLQGFQCAPDAKPVTLWRRFLNLIGLGRAS
jgi:hypothetical protein